MHSQRAKIAFTAVVLCVFLARSAWPDAFEADTLNVALILLAVLPWLDSVIKTAQLPGGWKLEFRDLQDKVAQQQQTINDLVRYSMSASIFTHLCGIALLRSYLYSDSDVNRREFYFLRDNGYIRPKGGSGFVEFGPDLHGKNVLDFAEVTPIGIQCVRLRKSEVPAAMRADLANLRVPLDDL